MERADVQACAQLGERPWVGQVALQELARLRDELRGRRPVRHGRGPGRVAGREAVQGDQEVPQLRGARAALGRQGPDGLQGLEHPAQLVLVELADDDRALAAWARSMPVGLNSRRSAGVAERPAQLELVQLGAEEAVEHAHVHAAAVLVPGAGRDEDDRPPPERLAAGRADVQPRPGLDDPELVEVVVVPRDREVVVRGEEADRRAAAR